MSEGNKVLGLEPQNYVKITYILLLISAGLGLIVNLANAFSPMMVQGMSMLGLIGFAGLIMALLGLFAFPNDFSKQQSSHFKYIGVLFIGFFVVGIILASIFASAVVLWALIALLLGLANLALLYAGFKVWQAGGEATQETIKAELCAMRDKIKSKPSV